jgi:NAD(P)-dependent dehydrogenase (short-subunit alcohol dehydrogenase family)
MSIIVIGGTGLVGSHVVQGLVAKGEQVHVLTRSANLRQITHPFDTQVALPRHHVPDVGVDACASAFPLCWRRASTVCKAPEKIHFQDLLCQHPLESADLFSEGGLSRIYWRSFAAF